MKFLPSLGRTSPTNYNAPVDRRTSSLDLNRFSVVVATILLAYAIAQFIQIPSQNTQLVIGGIIIPLSLNFSTLVTLAVAGMTASGTDWILRDHPYLGDRSTIPHMLLPALFAWVLNVTLNNMTESPFRWVMLIVGGIFLYFVIWSEYNSLLPEDFRQPISTALLTALSYAMLLVLSVSLESSNQRLIITLPAIALGSVTMSMRVLQMRLSEQWPVLPAIGCMLVTSQMAAAIHYLPITPLSYGLVILGTLFVVVNFILNIANKTSFRRSGFEAILSIVIIWLIALWLN